MRYVLLFCITALMSVVDSSAQANGAATGSKLSDLRSTYDPRSGDSPMVLMAGPKDGVAYYQVKVRARQLYKDEKFAGAEPLLESLVRDYPRDPENWRMLAEVKEKLKKPLEAIQAHEHVGKLIGWDLEFWSSYNIAINQLAAGNKRAALDTLRRTVFEQHGFHRGRVYDWEEFKPIRDDPEFLEIVGRPDTKGWSREKGWAYDLDYLYNETKRVNPDYRDKPFPAEFTRRYNDLKAKLPQLSDDEIFIGMSRMLAALRQGHVILFHAPNNRYLPVQLYAFPEGIFIIDATDEHKALIGSRVVTFGSTPAEEALRLMAETRSIDGDNEYLWAAAELSSSYHLTGLGMVKSLDAVPLTIRQPDGTSRSVTLTTVKERLAPRMDKLVAPPNVQLPLFLSKVPRVIQETHWETALPDHDAMYVQVNNLRADKEETLPQFGQRLWKELDKAKPRNLIIDLRHNNGGTTQTYPELLRTIVAFTRVPGNQLYVLIGRRSYSATGNFVTDLERLAAPIFVGEATSECCNLYGDPTAVRLPYSGIQGELTAYKWQLSSPGDRRREMSPHVPVQLTADAYFKGQDPALNAVYQLIADERKKSGEQRAAEMSR